MTKARQSRTVAGPAGGAARRKLLLAISRQVSATIGSEFFRAIARHLADALTADCVIVAEFAGGQMERYRSVGAWSGGEPADFEYELAGSAMAQIALGRPCHWRSHASSRFPADELLKRVGAEACIAVPLLADPTHAIGALMAIYRQPVTAARFPETLLEIFAERAAAELARKLEEENLRQSEQRYRAFIAKNADAMWRLEFEKPIPIDLPEEEQFESIYQYGYLAEANDAFARLLGIESPDQLIGARIDEVAPRSNPTIREATMVGIRSGYNLTSVETNPTDASGHRKCLLRSQWGIVEDGHLQRIWGSCRDLTDLRHTELALDAAEQRMADLLESMHLFVLFLDLDGSIEFCNNYLFQVTGWPADELIGKDWLKILIPPAEGGQIAAELGRNTPDHSVHFESTLLTKSGSLHLGWDSTVLRYGEGMPALRALVGRDITEQKALQVQVLQAQKLAGIGRLAGGLAHDFNNLLTVILGYTSRLLEGRQPLDPAFFSLSEIQKAAERSAELAHRLLTFSRREIFRPQVVDLNALVEDMRSFVESIAGENIRIMLKFEAELRPVRVDPNQFHQLLLNLAANARDAMPHGGPLTIATANIDVTADEPQATGVPAGEYVLLSVADSGTGMTEEVKTHLFEPFFTTKPMGEGTGLGLAMIYGIVQQSAGYIRVDSEVGRGSTFRIFLPRAPQSAMPQMFKVSRGLPRGTETVLLVEDFQPDVDVTAAKALRGLGYSVQTADGPLQAMEISRNQPNSIQLMIGPTVTHGMPGEVLFDTVKEFQPGIKVLFVSSASQEAPMAENVLPQPFSRKALAFKVRELLDRR